MNTIDKTIYDNVELLPLDLSGWNGNHSIFSRLIEKTKPTTIIEVGTWKGQSAINMARYIKEKNYNIKIFCVDTWLGSTEFWTVDKSTKIRDLRLKNGYPQVYYQFLSNVIHSCVQDIILPFPNTSYVGYQYFLTYKQLAELIYIDASHEEEEIYRDLCNYSNLLTDNGIIFGDDYTEYWPGVKNAVNKFVQKEKKNLEIVDNQYWVINK